MDNEFDPSAFLRALTCPISLIQPGLYIGNRKGALNLAQLKALGIRRVIQIQNAEVQPFFPGEFTYQRFHLPDSPSSNITTVLPHALPFIAQGLALNEPVFVHCDAGVSRSGSVIVAYLMASRGSSFDEAAAAARAGRYCIKPNTGFESQLRSLSLESLTGYLHSY
jgi:hypothetical protein